MSDPLTIIVSGMVAVVPHQGGATWAILQYLLGLERLGHDVYFIEPIADGELHPAGGPLARSTNAAYFRRVMADFGLTDKAALVLSDTRETEGLPYERLLEIAGKADLLLNVSGMLSDEALLEPIGLRAYLDLDPAFIQLWHAQEGVDMRFDGHDSFVTVGVNIGQADCPIPTCGRTWIPTLQPVVLERWPLMAEQGTAFTTIANWRGYGSVEHEGVLYGQKAHSWRPIMPLPACSGEHFQVALAIHPDETADLAELDRYGWDLVDPAVAAGNPSKYAAFIRGSLAELGIAKSGYAASRSGWFSDRSVCYLASGKPVLAQNTGFGRILPVGEGIVAFDDLDSALAGVQAIRADWNHHSQAARALAEEYFDSDRVLARLLGELGLGR
jgi:hypothetical protein